MKTQFSGTFVGVLCRVSFHPFTFLFRSLELEPLLSSHLPPSRKRAAGLLCLCSRLVDGLGTPRKELRLTPTPTSVQKLTFLTRNRNQPTQVPGDL